MYPNKIDVFTEKLNKLEGNTYVIEEEVTLTNGVYEGELQHDNVSLPSLSVYSGPKLTGEKVENYMLSTPSKTPWKKIIKIFSNSSKVYVTYETQGDLVEAEDINGLQDSIVSTQKTLNNEMDRAKNSESTLSNNLNLYKESNNAEVQRLREKDTDLDNRKSDKTYVDIELNKRYLKEQVFTKDEVLQKIKDLIGVAPEFLDTFREVADALDNDPHFATTIMNLLSNKVDKVTGRQLSEENYSPTEKNKLAGIQDNANNYIHPSTHNVSIITGLHEVATNGDYNSLKNKPTSFPPAEHNHDSIYVKKGPITWNQLKGV